MFCPSEWRSLAAKVVVENPEQYPDSFLGKTSSDYADWIQRDSTWGGEIELSIYSEHLAAEIAVVDIETNNVYIYGNGRGFSKRYYVLYDGIHYDALVLGTGDDELRDLTEFRPDEEDIKTQFQDLAKQLRRQRQFTNVATFSLQCLVCGQGLVGQEEAVDHAQRTGHQNFGQF
ncbi:Yod1 [Symbiodinium microadriaticum]|nr:Yod1 [Symbiodinium microadriaticum]